MNDERIATLLAEIRDNQREMLATQRAQLEIAERHFEQAKSQIAASLELQREAVARARLAQRIAVPGIVACVAAIAYLVFRYF